MPAKGRILENTLNDKAAKDPSTKPTKPTTKAAIRLDSLVSSHNHETGASIIAIEEVNAAKNNKTKNKAPNTKPPDVWEKAIGNA